MVYRKISCQICMIDHNIEKMSESEEMYLITIAHLVEEGVSEPIAISRLAGEMSIQPVSTNQMVHKLGEEGLVTYLPYKGVKLTPKGNKIASSVIRRRRLWELFLVEQLQIAPSEADDLACRFEHITPKSVIQKLDDFLGHPSFNSQGSPIPMDNSDEKQKDVQPLIKYPIGQIGEVVCVDSDPVTKSFLYSVGLKPGAHVCPQALSDGGPLLLKIGSQHLYLASEVINGVLVKSVSDGRR
ncbi:MAG: metal-dependent transcriptional regulator [Anaerolineae bacterium]|nr:MAG: metal-dependent transcriptional regulator [Anaerolineae bacterium]